MNYKGTAAPVNTYDFFISSKIVLNCTVYLNKIDFELN